MPFPLPIDPDFRKEAIRDWVEDVYDRLAVQDSSSAQISWNIANSLYLSLPAGQGDFLLESALMKSRVKIEEHTTTQTNANS